MGALAGARPSSRIPRVGYLPSAGTSASAQPTLQALRQGLGELGRLDQRDLIIEPRWTEGRVERLPQLAAELAGTHVDVIVTLGAVATRAAQNATEAIPIVFAVVIDPVAAGLVPDWQRPGGNLTGVTSFDPHEMRPHLELLKEAIPTLVRVAFLGDGGLPGSSPEVSRAWDERQARAAGLQAQSLRVRGPRPDLEGAIAAARREGAEALLVLEMPATVEHRRRIAELATSYQLPTLYVGSYADSGGLIAYGTTRDETGRQLAAYVDKILKGGHPGALPVGRLTHHELTINLETARSLGIAMPSSLLERADRVIH